MSENASPPFAVGFGYDVHAFATGRGLILGGVEIEYAYGLAGHSDADVLLHAIMDAILGAAGLEDIGHLFPNTDEKWKGASSRELLRIVRKKIEEKKWYIGNIDAMLVAEEPKIHPHIGKMKENIAEDLGIEISQAGIKATTNERMGFVGRKEGIAAMATALLYR